MAIAIAPERLMRALDYITEQHTSAEALSYETARRILNRTNLLIEARRGLTIRTKHEMLRIAAARELDISTEQASFYRKVVNAYWRFAPKRKAGP